MNTDQIIPKVLYWQDDTLTILDQTQLPHRIVYDTQTDIEQMWQSIHSLKIRGAPAIGVAAAYGCLTGMSKNVNMGLDSFKQLFSKQASYLVTSRPTAVNLSRSVRLMMNCLANSTAETTRELYSDLVKTAKSIHKEDVELCAGIGKRGLPLITHNTSVLTHCNAGALATTGIGTATAPIYTAHNKGMNVKVYADETRPLLQGARLTAWELEQSGVDVTLICDNMAADLMSKGKIDIVITGCDRVALNGDGANKIGTLGVAVLAKHYGIPFYMACPSSTIDKECATGADIPIEIRSADEVRMFNNILSAPANINVYNPSFDITPAELVTGYITENGIINYPYGTKIKEFIYEKK